MAGREGGGAAASGVVRSHDVAKERGEGVHGMANGGGDFRVVIYEAPGEAGSGAVRQLLCDVMGMHPSDASQWVARTPGIWSIRFTREQAQQFVDGLYELEIPAEAWPVERIPNLNPARVVHTPVCLADGLRITGLRGEPTHWIPWGKVELIHAGWIDQPDEVRDVVAPSWVQAVSIGLNAALRRPRFVARRHERTIRNAREPVAEAILVRMEPRLAFRFTADKLNYGYLGERLQSASTHNFPIFLRDLCEHASTAEITRSTRRMLEAGDEGEEVYPDSQALLEDATLRLLWSWYRRDRQRAEEEKHGEDRG
jgi:hypothetical protein